MRTDSDRSGLRREESAENRFSRHPRAALGIVLVVLLVCALLAVELFLKTFSGLGNPLLYELNPLFGYRPLPNQVVEPKGGLDSLYAARVTTNNLGLRAADEWDGNPAGKILFLGDSVTYGGQYIADGQLFSSVASRSLPGWSVGNGGVNAWGVENIAGLVVDHGFAPAEVVVTCVIEGDFYRGTTRAASVPLWTERPRFALQDLLMHLVWQVNESRYGSSVDKMARTEQDKSKIVDRAARRLAELDEYLRHRQFRHVIFILPTQDQVVAAEPVDPMVRQALAHHAIDVHYLLPALRGQEPDAGKRREWFHDNVHLEPIGHAAYGAQIGKVLVEHLAARQLPH